MITRLYLDNAIRHFDKTFVFDKGLTAISGPNESGKSLIPEFIRFALFGSKALRGEADDYKKLHVELDFCPRGTGYKVVRKAGKATLYLTGIDEPIATGTKPVNDKIISILGYDLTVFDTAHMCNQGEVEKLSNMTPGERKAMVDQTIGLTALDDVDESVKDWAKEARNRHDAMTVMLTPPVEPTKPVGYRPIHEIIQSRTALMPLIDELNEIRGRLRLAAPVQPIQPVMEVTQSSSELLNQINSKRDMESKRRELFTKQQAIPTVRWTQEEYDELLTKLVDWEMWQERQLFVSSSWAPEYTVEQLDQFEKDWAVLADADELTKLTKQLNTLKTVKCTSCGHDQHIDQATYDDLKAKADAIHVPEVWPPLPPIKLPQIVKERHKIESYGERWEFLKDAKECANPGITSEDLNRNTEAVRRQAEREALGAEILSLEQTIDAMPDNLDHKYQRRLAYEKAVAVYDSMLNSYNDAIIQRQADEKRSKDPELLEAVNLDAELVQLLRAVEHYDMVVQTYETQLRDYRIKTAKAEAEKAKAEEYDHARRALKAIRLRVKEHLVPSLSAVASRLLEEMTNGKRCSIDISEDFDVLVDGTKINKLSGSGKAVANLAIRIGLGQVLTNKVLSLFMGDEIDAAMDSERAEATAACLKNLSRSIDQVVLVSHKAPEADQYIQLE